MVNSLNPSHYISYLRSSVGTVATKMRVKLSPIEVRITTATVHREVLGLLFISFSFNI